LERDRAEPLRRSTAEDALREARALALTSTMIVQLSVGGTRFESPRSTLLRVRDSFFHLLLGADEEAGAGAGAGFPAPRDGVYRIDRSPQVFGLVLEYLRSGVADMALPDAAWSSAETMSALGRDASFFMLDELADFVVRLSLLKRWPGMLPRNLLFAAAAADELGVVEFSPDVAGPGAPPGDGRRVGIGLLRELFPALHALVAAEAAKSHWAGGAAWETSVRPPRSDCLFPLLRFAVLKGSSTGSWALAQPAAQHLGFTFISPARIEVQRLFDGAEEVRLFCLGDSYKAAREAIPEAAALATAGAASAGTSR
jgi:hypothetical protein